MKKPKIRSKHGPEWKIQKDLMRFLRERNWWIERTHGNLYQQGFPDLYVAHNKFGTRWIDVKNPVSWEFTKAQRRKWPVWDKFGIGIWILTAANDEAYDKLFNTPNWRDYWKPRYDIDKSVDDLIEEMLEADNELIEAVEKTMKDNIFKGMIDLSETKLNSTGLDWLDSLGGPSNGEENFHGD